MVETLTCLGCERSWNLSPAMVKPEFTSIIPSGPWGFDKTWFVIHYAQKFNKAQIIFLPNYKILWWVFNYSTSSSIWFQAWSTVSQIVLNLRMSRSVMANNQISFCPANMRSIPNVDSGLIVSVMQGTNKCSRLFSSIYSAYLKLLCIDLHCLRTLDYSFRYMVTPLTLPLPESNQN